MRRLLPLAFALAGCGATLESSCERYVVAFDACVAEYAEASGLEVDNLVLGDAWCDAEYADPEDVEEATEYLDCLADVYERADCSDGSGWADAQVEQSQCT